MWNALETGILQCCKCGQIRQLQRFSCATSKWTSSKQRVDRRWKSHHTHYDILGLKHDAKPEEIKEAFVKLSKEIHPDMNLGDPSHHEKFIKLNEAYTILSRPQSRREYDFSLAHQLYHQQHIARNVYGSHMPGSSAAPGSDFRGQYKGEEQQERVFWDESIWYMRDKSKDATRYYSEDMYYGVKGIKRLPNSYVIAFCLAIMGVGVLLHLAALRYSMTFSREVLDKRDIINNAILKEAKERARLHGNAKQLQILRAQFAASSDETSDGSSSS